MKLWALHVVTTFFGLGFGMYRYTAWTIQCPSACASRVLELYVPPCKQCSYLLTREGHLSPCNTMLTRHITINNTWKMEVPHLKQYSVNKATLIKLVLKPHPMSYKTKRNFILQTWQANQAIIVISTKEAEARGLIQNYGHLRLRPCLKNTKKARWW